MDLARLTAPRRLLRIATDEGDVECYFSPLTLRDNEELLLEMLGDRPSPLTAIKPHLDGLSDAERLRLLEIAAAAELRPYLPSPMEFELWKQGALGGPRTWWRMLRRNHSTIDLEQANLLWNLAADADRAAAGRVNEVPLKNSSGPATGPSEATSSGEDSGRSSAAD